MCKDSLDISNIIKEKYYASLKCFETYFLFTINDYCYQIDIFSSTKRNNLNNPNSYQCKMHSINYYYYYFDDQIVRIPICNTVTISRTARMANSGERGEWGWRRYMGS